MFLPSVLLLTFSSSLCHCELSKKVWQSHFPLYLSSFAFVLFLSTLITHTITIRYSYTLICIILLTTNTFPLHLRHSGTPFVIFSPICLIPVSLYVIPAKAGIHLSLSLRSQVYQGVTISFPLYSNILRFFRL